MVWSTPDAHAAQLLALPAAAFGPPAPLVWRWQPPRRENEPTAPPPAGGAFAALARLVA